MFPTWWLCRHCCSAVASQQHKAGLIPGLCRLSSYKTCWSSGMETKMLEVPSLSICISHAMDSRPVLGISLCCDQCMLREKELEENNNDCFPQLQSNGETIVKGETHRELCMWLFSVSFLADICFLWEVHRLQIVILLHSLCDCSIMCAMLLWMLWPPLSWKLLLIHDYPLIFLSGLNHLLQTCSLFISLRQTIQVIKINTA